LQEYMSQYCIEDHMSESGVVQISA
jgi:hypothetical protein